MSTDATEDMPAPGLTRGWIFATLRGASHRGSRKSNGPALMGPRPAFASDG